MIKFLLRRLVGLLFRVKLTGAVDQSFRAKTLFVANHTSLLDGLLLALFLPVRATFLVHTEVLENSFYRFLLKGIDHFAIDPTNPMALKAIARLLEEGRPIVIFPEGRITLTGGLMKIYDGAAFVAARTEADVVSVHLDGPARSKFSYLKGRNPLALLPQITMHFMPARKLEMPEGGTSRQRREALGALMRQTLQHAQFSARRPQTIFEGFLRAVAIQGRSTVIAEDIQFVETPSPGGATGTRKAFVVQTYGDILQSSLAVSRIVSRISAPGESVGVLLPNSTGTAAVILGLLCAGRVPAMLNFTAGLGGIQNALVASATRSLLTSRRFVEMGNLGAVISGLQGVTIHYMEDLKKTFTIADKLWLKLYAMRAPGSVCAPVLPSDVAAILFTSGSEGKPKGVAHTHNSLLANVAQVNAVTDFSAEDKFMVCLPLFHSFGFTAGMLLPLLSGCQVFFYPTPLHYRIIPELVYDKRATVLFGTSTFLGNYAKFAHPVDFGSLRYVVAGAEKLSDAVRNAWSDKFGIRVLEGYGITETGPVLAVNTPMAFQRGTVGALLPGIEHKLEAIPGILDAGLLHVRGPNLLAGYYLHSNPGVLVTHGPLDPDGWYGTGDVVTVDKGGFVSIKGRAKRFAKLAGEMVSLEVAETIAAQASPSAGHAVVSRPDAAKGEVLVLFSTDRLLTTNALASKAHELGLPSLAVAKKLYFLDAIPLLGTGKVDYVTLNAMALTA